MMNRRSAFTYIELMIVVVIVAIVTIVAMPDGDAASKEEGKLAGYRFEADVSFARSGSIARPDDPLVIKVDAEHNRYWLARESNEDVPIAHPTTGKPYLVQFGPDGGEGYRHVKIVGKDFDGDSILRFDSLGGTDQETTAILQLSSSDSKYEVAVSPISADTETKSGFTKDLGA